MSATDLTRGIDLADSAQLTHRGLDLTNLDETTEEEKQAFRAHYRAQFGYDHAGLNFWLEHDPAVLKRYRLWCGLNLPVGGARMIATGYTALYALMGFAEGVKYNQIWNTRNKQAALEQLAIGFLHCGPAGMVTVARALEDMDWPQEAEPLQYEAPYFPDPAAFSTGIDFSNPELTDDEYEKVKAWYMKYLGELPGYVTFLGRYRPKLLKAYRNRIEHMLVVLPKQALPLSLLHLHVMRGHAPGIRENVLWSRGFGVPKEDLLTVISNALVYGAEGASLVEEVAGDLIDHWPAENG